MSIDFFRYTQQRPSKDSTQNIHQLKSTTAMDVDEWDAVWSTLYNSANAAAGGNSILGWFIIWSL